LTVLGKSLTLAFLINSSPAGAFTVDAGRFTNNLTPVSFGWFKRLDNVEESAYYASIMQALFTADEGELVVWYKGTANGATRVVATYPTGGGYCRRLQVSVTDFNRTVQFSPTACFQNGLNAWTWFSDK
jgi:hypothetical protein